MKFTISLTIDTDRADMAGEALRELFFDQRDDEVGCYSTFKLNGDVRELPDFKEDKWTTWHRAELRIAAGMLVQMAYYWDGDGDLKFTFPDGTVVENTDCKKDHGWTSTKKRRRRA